MVRRSTLILALLLVPATVVAQGTGWEIEVHGGGASASASAARSRLDSAGDHSTRHGGDPGDQRQLRTCV